MMQLKLHFLLLTGLLINLVVDGQKKYNGTVFTKLGQELKGEILLNLDGGNNEFIEITTTEITKSKGTRQSLTTTTKINTAIISRMEIKGKTYYFRDIKIGYNDQYLNNVCVQLIFGNTNCGLFQTGDGKSANTIAVKFPKEEFIKLSSVDFEYYNTSMSVAMQVSSCPTLLDKMMASDDGVTWTEKENRAQRIQRFKNIISDYNNCKIVD